MARPKTIVLWGRDDLIGMVLERIISDGQQQAEVMRLCDAPEMAILADRVNDLKPQVILLNRDEAEYDPQLPVRLMRDHPDIRVITVSLENNEIEVYDRHRIEVHEKSDLLDAIAL